MKTLKKILLYVVILPSVILFLIVMMVSAKSNKKEVPENTYTAQELKAYQEEIFDAQVTCNSVIQEKFENYLSQYEVNKLIMIGYKDETIGQFGYKGSQKKEIIILDKNIKFRWSWDLVGSGKFIKCLIKNNGKYSATLEKY